jgi:hypothetical protein
MHKLFAAVLVAVVATSSGCARGHDEEAGPVVSRGYQVANFTGLDAVGPFDVTVRTGAGPSVQARGNQSLIDKLVVEVKGDKLLIHPKEHHGWFGGWHNTRGKADITVTVPELRAATLAGAGGITIDKVQGDSFNGQIQGSGDLDIASISVNQLKLAIAGAGSVSGAGAAKTADYNIAGSGDVKADGIAVEDLKVGIAGAGNVRAHATRSANIDIMGSGSVDVTGGAKCSVSKMGSGDVHCS